VAGANADHNSEKMEAFLAAAMEDGIVVDGVLNGSERESVLSRRVALRVNSVP